MVCGDLFQTANLFFCSLFLSHMFSTSPHAYRFHLSPSSPPPKSSEGPKSPPLEVNSCYLSIGVNPSDGFVLADSSTANLLPAQFVRLALHLCSIWSEGSDVSTAGWWETSFRLLQRPDSGRIWGFFLVRFCIWCESSVFNLPLIFCQI